MINENGYLEIIVGPMYAGKTSKLIEIYKQYKYCNIDMCIINHATDIRYSDNNSCILSTHDKIQIPCINLYNLNDIVNDEIINKTKVIIINEGQFFNDIVDFVKNMLKLNKTIYICGLDGDFKQNKIGYILDLIPLCDKIEKITALCALCKNGTKAIFSKRLTEDKEQIVIGNDNYIPVCRKCINI